MVGKSWARLACKHCRTVVVWAMVPLTALNGHTAVGCGCTGHFMAQCQCHHPDLEQRTANAKTPTCPLCAAQAVKTSSCCGADHKNSAMESQGLRGHRCCRIAIYDFVPGTNDSLAAGDQQQVLAVLSAPVELPFVFSGRRSMPELLIDPGHPDDLVVLLRRLLI